MGFLIYGQAENRGRWDSKERNDRMVVDKHRLTLGLLIVALSFANMGSEA